jgi:hypothetical protein
MRRCSSFGSDEADQFEPPPPKWVEAEPEDVEIPEMPTGLSWWDTDKLVEELQARGYLVVHIDRLIPLGTSHDTLGPSDLPDPYGNYPRGRPDVFAV